MRCYNLKAASAISDCLLRDGPIRCALAIRTNVSTPSGIISGSTGRRIRDCASIIFCSTPNCRHDSAVPASIAGSATRPAQATTRRPGSSWIWARRRKERNGSPARSSGPTLRQRSRLVPIAGKVTVANDRCQHGYAQTSSVYRTVNKEPGLSVRLISCLIPVRTYLGGFCLSCCFSKAQYVVFNLSRTALRDPPATPYLPIGCRFASGSEAEQG